MSEGHKHESILSVNRGIPKSKEKAAAISAVSAAVLYSISSPLSKILLSNVTPAMMAGLLYLGAGVGMSFIWFIRYKKGNYRSDMQMSKNEVPYVIAMVFLDILAPVLLMTGLKITSAANVALLSNFEIVATSIIALIIFKESVGKRLGIAIILITLSSIILSVKDQGSLDFSYGSIIVLLAAVCWGIENNCTRMLSFKDPLQVVIIKGLGAGIGSLMIAFFTGQVSGSPLCICAAMILGFASYGLGVYLYVNAQRVLGAAKTSTYYAVSPFIGAAMSFIIFMEVPGMYFVIALIIMLVGTYFASTDEVREAKDDYR